MKLTAMRPLSLCMTNDTNRSWVNLMHSSMPGNYVLEYAPAIISQQKTAPVKVGELL